MNDTVKYQLSESQIPADWHNLQAGLPVAAT